MPTANTGKRKAKLRAKRRVRHKESARTDLPSTDKSLGKCARREYGGGVASGTRKTP